MLIISVEREISQVVFLRTDWTTPWLFRPMDYLAGLSSLLAQPAIGAILGEVSSKKAASEKTSWYYSLVKIASVPALSIVILAVLVAANILPVNFEAPTAIVIMVVTPAATVAVAYTISLGREALLASNAFLLLTILAVVLIPVWIAALQMTHGIGLF